MSYYPLGGILEASYSIASEPYNVLALSDNHIIWYIKSPCVTINLPATGGLPYETTYEFVDESARATATPITINANGATTINGLSTYVLNTDYQSVKLRLNSFGTNWLVF